MTTTKKTNVAKSTNYTPEQEAQLKALYVAGNTDKASLAKIVGKSERSIVAKLSRMGIYKKQEYKTKSGEAVTSKEDIVESIATIMGVSSEVLGGLEKANKSCLQLIAHALAEVSAMVSTDDANANDADFVEETNDPEVFA
jgi:hypothetical protein